MALYYRITVKGALDEDWSPWFYGLAITHNADGNTRIEGAVRDQTALYGLIDKARDLGLTLLAIEQHAATCTSDCLSPSDDICT